MILKEEEKIYSAQEVEHMVAREVAKQRLADLERALAQTNEQVVKMWAKFDASFESLQRAIDGQETKLRIEIERDFASKLDLEQLKNEVGKIWLKVSIPVSTIVLMAEVYHRFVG